MGSRTTQLGQAASSFGLRREKVATGERVGKGRKLGV
jgi:hypothetical protein